MKGAKKYQAIGMKKNDNFSAKTTQAKDVPILKDPMRHYRRRCSK